MTLRLRHGRLLRIAPACVSARAGLEPLVEPREDRRDRVVTEEQALGVTQPQSARAILAAGCLMHSLAARSGLAGRGTGIAGSSVLAGGLLAARALAGISMIVGSLLAGGVIELELDPSSGQLARRVGAGGGSGGA